MSDAVKLGIENLKKIVKGIATIANVADAFGHEKGTSRWQQLIGLGDLLRQLNGIAFAQVLAEVKDLDKAERDELRAMFDAAFDLRDDQLEAAIEKGMALSEKIAALVGEAKDFVAELKA